MVEKPINSIRISLTVIYIIHSMSKNITNVEMFIARI